MIFQNLMGLRTSRCDVLSGPPKNVFTPMSVISSANYVAISADEMTIVDVQ
jgi:hypothetical protein